MDVLLEVGPGRTLTSLATQSAAGEATAVSSFTAATGRQQAGTVQDALGDLWKGGVGVDWQAVYQG